MFFAVIKIDKRIKPSRAEETEKIINPGTVIMAQNNGTLYKCTSKTLSLLTENFEDYYKSAKLNNMNDDDFDFFKGHAGEDSVLLKTFNWEQEVDRNIYDINDISGEMLAVVENRGEFIIRSGKFFEIYDEFKKESETTKFIGIPEFAEMHRKSQVSVRKLCYSGRIKGAKQISGAWIIPIDAEYPADRRKVATHAHDKKMQMR